jgi:CBS domain-containing protein
MFMEDKIGSLPVLEGGKVVGIVTETDVLRQICKVDAACSEDISVTTRSRPTSRG